MLLLAVCIILFSKALDYQKENARLAQKNEDLQVSLNRIAGVSTGSDLPVENLDVDEMIEAEENRQEESMADLSDANDMKALIREYAEQGKSFISTLKAVFSDQFVLADEGRFYFKDIDPTLRPYSYDSSLIELSSDGIISYDDETAEVTYGIDVSQYNGEIDWETMKNSESRPDFVYVRLGIRGYQSGKLVPDTQVSANLIGARDTGAEVGVYFVTQAVNEEEAREEARFVIETLSDNSIDLPVALDVEKVETYDTEPRTKNLSPEDYTKNVLAFADEMDKLGHETIIYGNGKSFMLMMDVSMIDDMGKWFADYVAKDDYIPYFPYDFSIWQFTSQGRVPGVTGDCDLNIKIVKTE
ncbi:MAG: hypothetical protein II966_05720 [Lachnospiraceae bacterium]|nr:hypothetical protein [Lachnospiraceae bacterium]